MKQGRKSTLILIIVFFVGLSLLLYPSVSDYWNSLTQSRAVSNYAESVSRIDRKLYDELLAAAREFNEELRLKDNRFAISDEDTERYNKLLNLAGDGVIGYIEIPAIGCSLPIYHGISDEVLQRAIGHLEWSSLPIGGEGTHSVVSGHRGLPSAKLFTDLDRLENGDIFMIRVLDETVTYEVDQILIVDPHDINSLGIELDKDFSTLVTCTPYGINTHRLLVRGHRIENLPVARTVRVTADAIQIDPLVMTPLVAAPMLLVLFIRLMLGGKKKN